MFDQTSFGEMVQSREIARRAEEIREGARMTELMGPWFEGLESAVRPLRVRPMPPPARTIPHAVGYVEWNCGLEDPETGETWASVNVRMFLTEDREASASVEVAANRTLGRDGDVFSAVGDAREYADETLGDAFGLAHSFSLFRGADG